MSTYIQSAVSNSIGLGINVYKTGNSVGIINVGIGGNVFNNNSTGKFNTGIGANVFASNVSGSYNTGIGANSGNSILGSYSTSLGSNAGQAPGDTNVYNNSTAIGYGAVVNASGQIVMGTANEYVTIPSTGGGLVVGGGDLNVSGNIFINGLLAGTTTTGSSNLNFGSNPLTAGAVSANSLNLAGGVSAVVTAGNMSIGTMTSGSLNAGTNPLTAGNMSVGTIVGGLVNATSLSTGSITVGNVFASTVTGGNLSVLGTITTGPLTVTSTMTSGNMSVGTILGGVTSLISLSVGSINAGSVSTGNLTCGVMTVGTVTAGNLTLGTNALTGGNMSVGTVTVGGLAVTSVSTGTVSTGTLTTGTNPLTVGNITVGTITSGSQNMATNPLTAGNVSTGAITVGNSNANATVTATSISAGTITAGLISTGTLSCTYLSSISYTPTITVSNYNFGTNPLTAGSISVGTIVSNSVNLGGNSLFVGGISVGTVTVGAINLAGNPITAGNISVGSITSTSHNMGTNQLTAGNLSSTTIYGSGMGIATTSPAYTLDVNGNVNCTGGYYLNGSSVNLSLYNYGGNDGSTSAKAAISAKYIQQTFNQVNDGVYWINLPTVGATQIYCIMNPAYAGGGWMLAMKGTQGTTFNFDANYWTTTNTLNPSDNTRNNADAKFNTFNYFPATDWLAIFPDAGTNGGDLPASLNTGWAWYEPNAVNVSIPLVTWFSLGLQITKLSNNVVYYGTNPQPINSQKYNSNVWSNETGMQFYGINYTGCAVSKCRWGFNFNNESDQISNDARGGIGIKYQNNNALGTDIFASAGDFYYCCGTQGLNRQMRFEWYVR
jgi:hypothetical protein